MYVDPADLRAEPIEDELDLEFLVYGLFERPDQPDGVSEIACHPFSFGHLRDLIAFAGSHCLPVGYFILWDFGSVLWDACGLLELVSWVRSTCWTADQNAH